MSPKLTKSKILSQILLFLFCFSSIGLFSSPYPVKNKESKTTIVDRPIPKGNPKLEKKVKKLQKKLAKIQESKKQGKAGGTLLIVGAILLLVGIILIASVDSANDLDGACLNFLLGFALGTAGVVCLIIGFIFSVVS